MPNAALELPKGYNIHRSFIADVVLSAVLPLSAQLIPAGQAVPRTIKPPVIFVNAYESDCGSTSFKDAFGIADQALQANGQVSLFFNYCTCMRNPPKSNGWFTSSLPSVDLGAFSDIWLATRTAWPSPITAFALSKTAALVLNGRTMRIMASARS